MLSWFRSKELKMVWEIEGARGSFLVGTAHFFPHSFRASLVRLLSPAEVAIFEGPLDEASLARVVQAGRIEKDAPHLFDLLAPGTVSKVEKALADRSRSTTAAAQLTGLLGGGHPPDARGLVAGMKPWLAFFTLWTTFLANKGWTGSVDMEAHRVALELGKDVVPLETIEEQIDVLESLSVAKILDFLARADQWDRYGDRYARLYLDGDLPGLMTMATGFPSRVPPVIEDRDAVFHRRMLPILRERRAVVFVGLPHVPGIRRFLARDGLTARPLFGRE